MKTLDKRIRQWETWAPDDYGVFMGLSEDPSLMYQAGQTPPTTWDTRSWATLSSMRGVDASSEARKLLIISILCLMNRMEVSMSGKPIRRTQAIAPFGPGAIVDFPGPVSMIHAGLDAYDFDENNSDHLDEYVINDEARLSARLGVKHFVQPMEFKIPTSNKSTKNVYQTLPFLRFPLWHMCPRCGILHKSDYHKYESPVCTGPIGSGKDKGKSHPKRICFQVRFVTVCQQGHIADFPWCEWISEGSSLLIQLKINVG